MMDGRKEGRGKRKERLAALMVLLVVLVLGGLATRAAAAQGADAAEAARSAQSHEAAKRAIGLVRSPYCPGLMLEVCPSREAELLRDSIRMMAAQGLTSDELVEWMVASHGEEWRAVPKRQGWGLWAWILPPFALVFGAGVVAVRLRSMRAAPEPPGGPDPEDMTPEERARLDAALEELERMHEQEEPA